MSGKFPFEGYQVAYVMDRVTHGKHPDRPESVRRDGDPLWKITKSCWNRLEKRPSATDLIPLFH